MKKQVVLGLALMIGTFSFAQKKELKTAEKAIKSSNYADAKTAISAAEALLSAMDDKTKAKFYFLKGQALYANGAGSDAEITDAISNFKMLRAAEKASGKQIYTSKVDAIQLEMSNAFIKKGSDAYEQKNYAVSASNFESAYRISSSDTLFLYNAATVAVSGKDYDTALKYYDELMSIGYSGITTEYLATNDASGEEESFPSITMRDISVKSGTHSKARNANSASKVGEMAKNVALIHVEQGNNEKALLAIEKAKQTSPNDFNLIISEANVHYQMGHTDKYQELVRRALELEPNNVDLLFNLGVFAAEAKDFEGAKSYYSRALEVDPTYNNARLNTVALLFDEVQMVVDEMNGLGTSAADNKKYDELNIKKDDIYKNTIPYLEKVLEIDPSNLSAAKTLKEVYGVLGDDANFKIMKAKVEEMENQN